MAKTKARWQRWSANDIKRLRKFYRNMTTVQVAKKLGRTVTSVQAKAFALGLRKTKKHLKSMGLG